MWWPDWELVEQLSGKHVELGPGVAQGAGILAWQGIQLSHVELDPGPEGWGFWRCMDPVWRWGLAWPEEQRARQSGAVTPQAYGAGTWQARCFFSWSWHGEAFHDQEV
jgi:hypothetical protein